MDKGYSLVDCISMNTMDAYGITQILTSDHHFNQEGQYTALMRQPLNPNPPQTRRQQNAQRTPSPRLRPLHHQPNPRPTTPQPYRTN